MEKPGASPPHEGFPNLPDELPELLVGLLMAEFDQLNAAFLANEERGERRVDVFMTLIAAVTAAVGLIAGRLESDSDLAIVVMAASIVLLVFGGVTLRRIGQRNVATSNYLDGLRRIRAFFVKREPRLVHVLPFPPGPEAHVRRRGARWGFGAGGLLETVAVMNSMFAAIAFASTLWLIVDSRVVALITGSVFGLCMWGFQMWRTQNLYDSLSAKRNLQYQATLEWWSKNPTGVP